MKKKTPWRDPIVEEIHRFREEYAKKFDYDPERIFLDLKRLEKEDDGPYVSFSREEDPNRSQSPATATNPPTAPARPSKGRGTITGV
jgi:hypothetical protein